MSACPARRRLSPAIRASFALHAAAPVAAFTFPHGAQVALAAVLSNHAVLAAAGMWPRSTLLGPNLRRLPPAAGAKQEVALTFDDGPDPEVTPRVLEQLDEAGASASFFCIGRAARAHPALVSDIVRRGHSVENHTDTHPNAFAAYGPAYLRREIGRAQTVLTDITGIPPAFFRAPMGLRSPLLEPVLAEAGLALISWTSRALDGTQGDPDAAEHRLTSRLQPGDILLMHDGRCARTPAGRPCVLETLPRVLRTLAQRGLKTRALPDVFFTDAPRKASALWADAAPARSAST